MEINKENFEEFFLLYADNELDESQRRAVEEFVKNDAEMQKKLAGLLLTVQHPGKISMPDKSLLLKKEPAKRYVILMKYAVAAALTGLIAWYGLTYLRSIPEKSTPLAVENPADIKRDAGDQPLISPNDREKASQETLIGRTPSAETKPNSRQNDIHIIGGSEPALETAKIRKVADPVFSESGELTNRNAWKDSRPLPASDSTTLIRSGIADMQRMEFPGQQMIHQTATVHEVPHQIRDTQVVVVVRSVASGEFDYSDDVVLGIPAEKLKRGRVGAIISKAVKILDEGNPLDRLLNINKND